MIYRLIIAIILSISSSLAVPALADDGCRYPFVWREAFQGDHVCVTPDIRARAARDNAAAFDRINPDNHDYGPDTCRYGYVWREAIPSDHVCVRPEIRAATAHENALADERRADSRRYIPAEPHVIHSSCCPSNMLVCPLGRHWCR